MRKKESDGHKIGGTDNHQIFLSPGLVLTGKRVKYEAGVQFPIYKDVGGKAAEDRIQLVFGTVITF